MSCLRGTGSPFEQLMRCGTRATWLKCTWCWVEALKSGGPLWFWFLFSVYNQSHQQVKSYFGNRSGLLFGSDQWCWIFWNICRPSAGGGWGGRRGGWKICRDLSLQAQELISISESRLPNISESFKVYLMPLLQESRSYQKSKGRISV